jgi:CheY-like chemotaxis protein
MQDQKQINNPVTQNVSAQQPGNQVNKSTSKMILLIEDDPVLCRMYSEKFRREGFEVLTAQDGQKGLKMALTENVDLVLLDIMLPRISGIDLLDQLRKDPKGRDMKVIALTNLADAAEKEKAIQLGVKDYLVKAMQTPEQVINKIKSYLYT